MNLNDASILWAKRVCAQIAADLQLTVHEYSDVQWATAFRKTAATLQEFTRIADQLKTEAKSKKERAKEKKLARMNWGDNESPAP